MIQKRKGRNVIVDVFLDQETHSRFKVYLTKSGLDESCALVDVLERGMTNYWVQEFKRLKQGYSPLEKLFTEFKKDNELLQALEHENKELKEILENESRQNLKERS